MNIRVHGDSRGVKESMSRGVSVFQHTLTPTPLILRAAGDMGGGGWG